MLLQIQFHLLTQYHPADLFLLNVSCSCYSEGFGCLSFIALIKTIEIKKNRKEKVIMNSGNNIEESIEGDENFEMLAGWWRVLHQSTDHLIIGKLIIPINVNIAAFLSPFLLSSYALEIKICPT